MNHPAACGGVIHMDDPLIYRLDIWIIAFPARFLFA